MKGNNDYKILGRISNSLDGRGVPDLTVEAWDKDLVIDDLLGAAITDKDGSFTIEFDSSYFQEICIDRRPDIYFKVYKERKLICSTEDSVLWNVSTHGIRMKIIIDLPLPKERETLPLYMKYNWFTRKNIALESLNPEESGHVSKLLNEHLRDEMLKAIGPGKPGIEKLAASLEIDYQKLKDKDLRAFIKEYLLAEAKKDTRLEEEIRELEETLGKAPSVSIHSLLHLDMPLKKHPVLAKDIRKAKALEFAKINNLKDDTAVRLAEKDLDLDEANEATLNELVNEKIITEKQIKDFKLTIDLSRLGGENIGLIKALKNDSLKSMEDFLLWEKSDWARLIQDNAIALPEGEDDAESYAESLRDSIEKTFPTKYLLKRIIRDKYDAEAGLLNSADKILRRNKTLIEGTSVNMEKMDWTGISASEKKKIEEDLPKLAAFANTYRYLGITGIVNDRELDTDRKKSIMSRRLSDLDTFYKNNPHIDLHMTDFLYKGTKLDWTGIDEKDRPGVKKQMMSYQRAFTLSEDVDTSRKLLGKGLDSAKAVSELSEGEFLDKSGMDDEAGRMLYMKAQENTIATSNFVEASRDALFGLFRELNLSNQSPIVNDLRGIDGYEELFGSLDYCDCEHCSSIFSPAAYFADLMFFAEENVSKKVFDPARTDHPLYLKNRRPDLWSLKLTCPNTTTLIPYLEVVNDVLGEYIEKASGISDVYNMLRQSRLSTSLPFNLPLEEVRLYLSHFELSLYEIYRLLREPSAKQRREKLKISEQELHIITTLNPAEARLMFGNTGLANFEVQKFTGMAGITRKDLDDLLNIRFLPEIAKVKIKTIKSTDDIQLYTEVLQNLSDSRLDLIHRYLRLWKKTGWTIRGFDLVLSSLKAEGLLNNLEENDGSGNPKILQVAELFIIQEALNLSVEEICVMAGDLPQVPVEENQKGIYERLFDLEKIFGGAATATLPSDKTQDKITPLLLSGLGINESELADLLQLLQIDTTVDQQINITVISNFFRHARIAKGLALSVEEVIHAIKLRLNGAAVSTLGQIRDLIEFTAWMKSSPFSLSELLFILHGEESSSLKYKHDINLLAKVVSDIQESFNKDQHEMLDTVLQETYKLSEHQLSSLRATAYTIPEIAVILQSEQTSSNIYANDIAALSAVVQQVEVSVSPDRMNLLKAYVQSTFNLTTEQLENEYLQELVSSDINGVGIMTALNAAFTDGTPDNPSDLDGLLDLVREFERVDLLFSKLEFGTESITFLIKNKEVFNIVDLKALTLDNLRNAAFYASLLKINEEMEDRTRDVLKCYQTNGNYFSGDIKALSDLWKQPAGLIKSLTDSLAFSTTALEAVRFLSEGLNICRKLGIEGYSLMKLKAVDYPGLQDARDVLIGAFSSKYNEEKVRKEKLEPYTDRLNVLKRDALCDYIIARRDTFKFRERSDLYNFFLLDVQMSGCFRTSRLVCAVSSLQLYIHRCLINLEQSDKDLNPAIEDIKVNPTWIPADEWEWRRNYRVWEANRKVFLYPENYIDPFLRDNKTHIFRELEEELLQEKITEESARTAYKKYVSRFAELTKLRYAGAYYHSIPVDDSDIALTVTTGASTYDCYATSTGSDSVEESEDSLFYLFARTNVQPYQYYYRTYNHYREVWGNWKKIEMAIEAEEVSSLMHMGKLYIYWTEVKSKEVTRVEDGDAEGKGIIYKVFVKYSFLNENGTWSSPQELYVGYTHSTEEVIYLRTEGRYDALTEDQKERKHDHVLEQFRKKVFRKPYALINEETKTPVKLSFIWSQKKGIEKVEYIAGPVVHSITAGLVTVRASIPAVSFVVTNDQFNISRNTSVDVTVKTPVLTISASVSVNMVLASASHAYCNINIPIVGSIHINLTPRAQTIPVDIEASTYDLSLSKNEIIMNPDNNPNISREYLTRDIRSQSYHYKDIVHPSFYFLKDEYDKAFRESERYVQFYVENGDESFTDRDRTLTQYASGGGYILFPDKDGNPNAETLTTILTDELSDILFARGMEQFLSLQTQELIDDCCGVPFDFEGPYGEYYWEMFFHIPFLIADHLNANQKFREAKWWYERIFDPTAQESPADIIPSDHNWRFRLFRNLNFEKLKNILIDGPAIETYKKDPFNPHAIARLRWNAYQKTIVMKYIDNLIDWGDHLFAQDTRESITEANMLYQLAADILGERPVRTGKCETAEDDDLTYEKIGPAIKKGIETGKGSEFLIILENTRWILKKGYETDRKPVKASKNMKTVLGNAGLMEKKKSLKALEEEAAVTRYSDVAGKALAAVTADASPVTGAAADNAAVMAYRMKSYNEREEKKRRARRRKKKWTDSKDYKDRKKKKSAVRHPGIEVVKQSMTVFCVPHNADLLKYWDRVEDRLFKIRNCMNISGVRRSLALFQPPIDPMMLVRARASGMSLEDISAMLAAAGKIPPYRFSYLIEKAKQVTQTVQSFGSALLSALEKKDVEELTLLRSVHERNILKMTRDMKKKQVKESQAQFKAMEENLVNVQNRIDYYKGLISDGLTGWETVQQVAKHTGTILMAAETVLRLTAGISHLVPQAGSPFAMKYGGKEMGDSQMAFSEFVGALARISDAVSASAGLEATFQRREQDWKQQLKLAEQEHKQVDKQVAAAEIRKLMAEKDLDIHEKHMEHADELHEFYKNKFTGLGLYTYLASTLSRLYRQAYNVAYDIAKMAERAYQFEIDNTDILIANDNWQFDRAGLLAGERLHLQLQKLEQSYIEKNVRVPEIAQSFSLSVLNTSELVKLRQTGTCRIIIPEVAFEVLYPGQYKRLIRSVRLSIPCVVGPYTNVSGQLTLLKSEVESEDKASLTEVLTGKNTSISTSSANNDAGMFEFNFRDERYLPFEGAGAVSEWELKLPSVIRSFNYNTIADVIMHINYTAKDGDRVTAEDNLAAVLTNHAATHGLYRLFSLKHEFPDAFHQLLNPSAGSAQTSEFLVEKAHFPYLLINRNLNIFQTKIYLQPKKGKTVGVPATLDINGTSVGTWERSNDIAMPGVPDTEDKDRIKGNTVSLTGSPVKTWTINAGVDDFDKNVLDNFLILITYKIS